MEVRPRPCPTSPDAAAPAAQHAAPPAPSNCWRGWTALGIAYQNHAHAAVFTVEEAKALRGELTGGHIKNLFLRNKKEEMWLVVAEEDKRIDLKALGERLGAGKLSFGSPDRLLRYLGVLPGAVTPFGIINDKDRKVKVVLDRDLLGYRPGQCPSAGQHHDHGARARGPGEVPGGRGASSRTSWISA